MKTLMPKVDTRDGLFHNGNPVTGEQGTQVKDVWLNNVQEKLRDIQAEAHYVLIKAGFSPVENKQTQLYESIVKIIGDNRKTATTKDKGEVKLNSAIDSEIETEAATPKAVRAAYDKGVEAKTAAATAQRTANDGVAKANAAQTSANAAQHTANDGVSRANAAQTSANAAQRTAIEANSNANSRVSKSGDTLLGILRSVGITSKQYGLGAYSAQYDSGAPFMVEETGSVNRDTYHPFVKGRVRSKNHYGAALSFGYTTKQGDGDGFGRGIIQLIEDNGNQKFWAFEHNGDFISYADVKTSSGASLNGAIQSNKISHATNGAAKDKVASEYALGELHKKLQTDERVVWQGSSNNAITVNLPFEKGVLFVCVTKSWGAGTVNNMWLAAPIGNSHDTAIGDQDAGGSAGDYDFSMSLIITKKGKAVTLTPGGARKPVVKKVVVVGV